MSSVFRCGAQSARCGDESFENLNYQNCWMRKKIKMKTYMPAVQAFNDKHCVL